MELKVSSVDSHLLEISSPYFCFEKLRSQRCGLHVSEKMELNVSKESTPIHLKYQALFLFWKTRDHKDVVYLDSVMLIKDCYSQAILYFTL